MLHTIIAAPAQVSSISLSLSNISETLAGVANCRAKDALMAELGSHFARFAPQIMAMNFEEVDGYDEFLRIKTGEAAKIRACAEACKNGACKTCKFCD